MKSVFLTLSFSVVACAAPMEFANLGGTVHAIGEITETTPSDFLAAGIAPGSEIYLDIPGGGLQAGLALGRLLRATQAHTFVKVGGACASACVDAFAGGSVRTYDEHYGPLGVHRFYGMGGDLGESHAQQTVADRALPG